MLNGHKVVKVSKPSNWFRDPDLRRSKGRQLLERVKHLSIKNYSAGMICALTVVRDIAEWLMADRPAPNQGQIYQNSSSQNKSHIWVQAVWQCSLPREDYSPCAEHGVITP